MALKRKEHWDFELHSFVDSRAGQPFEWGGNDCALFACDGIAAMTGTDLAGDYRGQYSTKLSALARIKSVTGGSTIEDVAVAVTAAHGLAELPTVRLAQRGDIVIFDGQEGPAIGLVYLNGTHAVFVGEQGLKTIPVLDCRRAWRLG